MLPFHCHDKQVERPFDHGMQQELGDPQAGSMTYSLRPGLSIRTHISTTWLGMLVLDARLFEDMVYYRLRTHDRHCIRSQTGSFT